MQMLWRHAVEVGWCGGMSLKPHRLCKSDPLSAANKGVAKADQEDDQGFQRRVAQSPLLHDTLCQSRFSLGTSQLLVHT